MCMTRKDGNLFREVELRANHGDPVNFVFSSILPLLPLEL
jgi:hypothetical protein